MKLKKPIISNELHKLPVSDSTWIENENEMYGREGLRIILLINDDIWRSQKFNDSGQ